METLKANELSALSVDPLNDLFVAEFDGGFRAITKYNSAGIIISRFGYDSIKESPSGIAPTEAGDVYVTETTKSRVQLLNPPPSGPLPCCLEVVRGNTKATLEGQVNPEGAASTYHFEYVDQKSFEDENGFDSPNTVKTAESGALAADFSLHAATAAIGCANPPAGSCLVPSTVYRYRLVAKSGAGENSVEGQFKTLPPFEVETLWATEVTTSEAKLHVAVNPLGIPTTGYFEYVDDATYQADLAKGAGHDGFAEASKTPDPGTPIDFGSGNAPVQGSAQLSGLVPGATYHYRAVVIDSFVTEPTEAHTLTAFPLAKAPTNACANVAHRGGFSAQLPACRAYEMVSPVDKNGGEIKVLGSTLNYPARLEQAATDGNRFAYSSITAFGDALSAPWSSEYLASRVEGVGWSTHAISPPRESISLTLTPAFKFDVQYKLFSPDLANGWLIHDTNPPLEPCAPEGVLNLYRRDNLTGAYEALTTSVATNIGADGYELELQGASADGSKTVYRANGALAVSSGPLASKSTLSQLYMHTQDPAGGCGETRLVSVLPNGKASALDSSLGTFLGLPGESRGNAIANAVSADGSRVFWSTRSGGTLTLYARDMASEVTTLIAAAATSFWSATPNGSRAFYATGEELFELDADKALASEPNASTLIGKGAKGLVATSKDGARVYFVSTQTLGGEGEAGKPNLYLREGGGTRLVATLHPGSSMLPGGDVAGIFPHHGFTVGGPSSIANGVRASADGSQLVFVSAASLTGYDNHDAVDGRPNLEIYLYDAAGGGQLRCISCNPSGARPVGKLFQSENDSTFFRRIAAQLPAGENQFTTPRVLSADGNSLFFESFESLTASDTNKTGDVYEWHRASDQAQCDALGAELYVPSAGGCLSLISSGKEESGDSELSDISLDGTDVFIRTPASLLPQDHGQIDLYDARVGGGLPTPPEPQAPCESAPGTPACPNPTSAPPSDSAPATQGPSSGNFTPPKPCPKGKVRRKGKCVKPKPKHHKKKAAKKKAAKKRAAKKRAANNGRAGR